jgi:hypothetical protein
MLGWGSMLGCLPAEPSRLPPGFPPFGFIDREGAAGLCCAVQGVRSAVRRLALRPWMVRARVCRRARARCGVSAHPTAKGSLGMLPRK